MYSINLELRTKQREKRDVSFGGIVLRDGYHHHIIIIIPGIPVYTRWRIERNNTTRQQIIQKNTKKYIYIQLMYVYVIILRYKEKQTNKEYRI